MNLGERLFFEKAKTLEVGEKCTVLFGDLGSILKVTAERLPLKIQDATADHVIIDDLGADQ